MKITKLPITSWLDYKNLYMESIANSPQAFLWSKEEIGSKEDSVWQDRIKNMFFAITDDEKLVGMAGFYCEEKKKLAHIANIVRVYVNPEYRGKGIGKQLLLTVIEDVKSMPEIRKIQLGVIATQILALNLYESVGFEKVGELKMAVKIDDHFYDQYLMEMILNEE